jgi:aspartate aminotransferase-like enzyme
MRNNLGIDINEMIQFIKKMYNTEISNGLFDLYNKIVRVGHIGQTATLDSVVPVLVGIEQFLRMKGRDIPLGASLSGVEKHYTKIVVSNNT